MVVDYRGKEVQLLAPNTVQFQLPLRFEDNKVPVSQTAYDFVMQIRQRASVNSRLVIELSTDNDAIVVDGSRVIITITQAQMQDIAAGSYYYSLNRIEIAEPTNIEQQMYGQFTVSEGVTL